jgi:hypothetical protein
LRVLSRHALDTQKEPGRLALDKTWMAARQAVAPRLDYVETGEEAQAA